MKATVVIILGAACLSFQSIQAALLFQEAFNYNVGALSGNINPGNNTAWSAAGPGLSIVSGNLTYAGLADLGGNELQLTNGTATSSINTFANQTSGQIYYSFLFNYSVSDSGNQYFTAMNPGTTAPNGSSDAIDAYFYTDNHIRLRANPQSATAGTGPVLTLNTTYLIVEEIDLDAKTANLWVNPDSSTFGTLTPPTATASLSGLSATAIANVGFKANSGSGTYLIDNLRIGTTWADVTPVPEPSTLALAGLGVLGLAAARRWCRG